MFSYPLEFSFATERYRPDRRVVARTVLPAIRRVLPARSATRGEQTASYQESPSRPQLTAVNQKRTQVRERFVTIGIPLQLVRRHFDRFFVTLQLFARYRDIIQHQITVWPVL